MATPNRGYVYPTTSSPATVPADLRVPLEQVDADVQTLVDEAAAKVGLNPDGTAPPTLEAQIEQIAQENGTPPGAVPVFATRALAEAWEYANPGRMAIWVDTSTDPDPDPEPEPDSVWVPPGATVLFTDGFSDSRTTFTGYTPDNALGGFQTPTPHLTVADAFETSGGTLRAKKTGRFLYNVGARSRGIYMGMKVVDAGSGNTRIRVGTGTTGDGVDVSRGELHIGGSSVGTLSYGNGDTIGLAVSGGQATAYVNGVQAATAPVPDGTLSGDYAGIIAANPTTHQWDDFVIAEMPA